MYQSELACFLEAEASINEVKFSPFLSTTLVAAYDSPAIFMYDVNAKERKPSLVLQDHLAQVRGLSFSPLNKQLLTSVGLDKKIHFYDITKGKKVSDIRTLDALSSVSFNLEGNTVAVGACNTGKIYVYDLRNQSSILATLTGHESTVSSVSFRVGDPKIKKPVPTMSETQKEKNSATQFKTMEQIREEARKNVEMKKQQML